MKNEEVCKDCGAPCKNKRKQDIVLCRSCWYARRSKEKADRDAKKLCGRCGGRVSDSAWKAAKRTGSEPRCKKCSLAVKAEEYAKAIAEENEKRPIFCKVCGKQIIRKDLFKCKTTSVCSPECHGILFNKSSVDARESKESLESRIIEVIKSRGSYTSLAQLRKIMKISDKLVYRRGISIPELNLRAGVIDYLVDNSKTAEELKPLYAELIRQNKSITRTEAARQLKVSVEYLSSIGLRVSEIRKSLGIFNKYSRTRQEVIDLCVPWIKEQGEYIPFSELGLKFNLDYQCSLCKNDLTIAELNRLAGFTEQPSQSYWERYTAGQLAESFSEVVAQKTFEDLRSRKPLRFDFFLPAFNVLIEVDGEQHYDPANPRYSEEQVARDRMKDEYIANHPELTLYRVPVTPRKTFKDRLQRIITTIQGPCSGN